VVTIIVGIIFTVSVATFVINQLMMEQCQSEGGKITGWFVCEPLENEFINEDKQK